MGGHRALKIVLVATYLILATTFGAGCFSAHEIDELSFIGAMGIDREGDLIKLTVQVIVGEGGGDGGAGGGASGAPVWVTSTTGNSLSEAVFNLHRVLSKFPFWSHSTVLIIGEDMAREGIREIIDWAGRDRQIRNRVRVAVALGKAEDILKIEPKMDQLPAEYLEALIRHGTRTGYIPRSELFYLRIAYANRPRMQILLPLVQPQPEEATGGKAGGETPIAGASEGGAGGEPPKPESMELIGSAVFRDDKMVGQLDIYETRGISWLTGTVRTTLVTVNRVEGQVTQRVEFASVRYRLNGQSLIARISQDGTLRAWPLDDQHGITPTILKQLEGDIIRVMEQEIRAALAKTQALQADAAGLGERMRRLNPAGLMVQQWAEQYPNLELELQIEAAFRRIGLTKE